MNRKPRTRSYGPKDTYIHLLRRSRKHAAELLEMLVELEASYPQGDLSTRDMFRTRNCILCAIESLLK